MSLCCSFIYLLKINFSGIGQSRKILFSLSLYSWCRRHRTQEAINKSLICQESVQQHYIKSRGIEVCHLRGGDQARDTWWDKSHNSVNRPVVLHHSWLGYIISLWKGSFNGIRKLGNETYEWSDYVTSQSREKMGFQG